MPNICYLQLLKWEDLVLFFLFFFFFLNFGLLARQNTLKVSSWVLGKLWRTFFWLWQELRFHIKYLHVVFILFYLCGLWLTMQLQLYLSLSSPWITLYAVFIIQISNSFVSLMEETMTIFIMLLVVRIQRAGTDSPLYLFMCLHLWIYLWLCIICDSGGGGMGMGGCCPLLHVMLWCKMAALCRGKVQLRLATLEKNREEREEQRRGKKDERERASMEELEWIECERSNQV